MPDGHQKVEAQFHKTDLRSTLISISANIVLGAKQAGNANSLSYEGLVGWGSEIAAFDSMIIVMVKDDPKFYKNRALVKKRIKHWSASIGSDKRARVKLFESYNSWFHLLCSKMPIFPEGSTNSVLGNTGEGELDD